jgi:hypothetical protein
LSHGPCQSTLPSSIKSAYFLIFFEVGLQILIYCYYQFIITAQPTTMLLCKNAKINANIKSKWACVMTLQLKNMQMKKSPNKIGSNLNFK